jgi:hypothetical protein
MKSTRETVDVWKLRGQQVRLPPWAIWLVHKLGRRGAFLLFLTILDACYGYALVSTSLRALETGPDLLLPPHVWGWIWVGVGVVCLTGAVSRRDYFQFAVAATLKAAWAAVYADIWVVQHGQLAWISVVVWGCFSMLVLVVASWPESRVARP